MQAVVSAVDLTQDAGDVLRVGAWLADRLDDRLVLATVVPPPRLPGVPVTGAAAPLLGLPPAALARDEAAAEATVDEERQRLYDLADRHGLASADVCVELDVHPAEGLRRIARDVHAALLVVGASRRGALGAAVLGSTAHDLCAGATTCPVVIVPRADCEPPGGPGD